MSGPESLSDVAIFGLALHLTTAAGKSDPIQLTRLSGGRNNQVYRIDTISGEPLILKRYFRDENDHRNRLAAEWAFLRYARERASSAVPEPIICDEIAQAGLYSFAQGRKLSEVEIGQSQTERAIDFVLAVNAPPRRCEALAPGSEACFSPAEHLATAERRMMRLDGLDPEAPHVDDARRFITGTLRPLWQAVKARASDSARDAGLSMEEKLPMGECCLSPSDFGFHNALVDERGVITFLDFEYAGRDDPAKLICDFFCQPELPVPEVYFTYFVDRLVEGLSLDPLTRVRCNILLDVYRIKWSCIILNDFLPLGPAHRAFANIDTSASHFASQLAKAQTKVAGISAHAA